MSTFTCFDEGSVARAILHEYILSLINSCIYYEEAEFKHIQWGVAYTGPSYSVLVYTTLISLPITMGLHQILLVGPFELHTSIRLPHTLSHQHS